MKEQAYFELLSRTDHPAFKRHFETVLSPDAPLNAIVNRVVARQFVKLDLASVDFGLNNYPDTATATTIDQWEQDYFAFTKSTKALSRRRAELKIKINRRIGLSVPDVVSIAQSITGMTPRVVRNLFFKGWVLGRSVLGRDTILGGGDQAIDGGTYLVIFDQPVSSDLLARLDSELTRLEKAGSTHKLRSPLKKWILGESKLGIDTILG